METYSAEGCAKNRRAVQDTLEIIGGKWKMPILITLRHKPFRFTELVKEIGITPRMLSKELHELEMNKLISRTELKTVPVSVEYAITAYGNSISPVLESLKDWGMKHRQKIIHNAV